MKSYCNRTLTAKDFFCKIYIKSITKKYDVFKRPIAENHLQISDASGNAQPMFDQADTQSYGYPFDINSALMYCSSCVTGANDPFDLKTLNNETFGDSRGLTTLDILKVSPLILRTINIKTPTLSGFEIQNHADNDC